MLQHGSALVKDTHSTAIAEHDLLLAARLADVDRPSAQGVALIAFPGAVDRFNKDLIFGDARNDNVSLLSAAHL
jgi:hypothetical protein